MFEPSKETRILLATFMAVSAGVVAGCSEESNSLVSDDTSYERLKDDSGKEYTLVKNGDGTETAKYDDGESVTFKRDDDGKPLYFAGTIDNHGIASEYDSVTALYTKDKLLDTLSDLKEEKQRYYILFVGMYNFGELNNVYGYEFGNKILMTF